MPHSPDDILKDGSLFSTLRLIRSEGIGPVSCKRLIAKYGSPENAVERLEAAFQKGKASKPVAAPSIIQTELDRAADLGITFLFLGHKDYPAQLAAIDDAPVVLSLLGDPALAARDGIGMVGARNCSAGGTRLTQKLSRDLSGEGMVIISGLARGIDTAAHKAGIEGGTIACMAGGVDVVYPKENQELYEQIAENGLIISEAPIGCKPVARHFPRRNRIISGLSRGVVLVEAALKSGSLITARYAAEQGRDVFAVPGSPLDPRAQGCNRLIKNGACLVQEAQDILDELGTFSFLPSPVLSAPDIKRQINNADAGQQIKVSSPTGNNRQIISYLSPTPIHIDELVRLTGQPVQALLTELVSLEMTGEIERHSGNLYSRISTENK